MVSIGERTPLRAHRPLRFIKIQPLQEELQRPSSNIGSRTRRLDIREREYKYYHFHPTTLWVLMDVLLLLPNLEILHITPQLTILYHFFVTHLERHLPNLKALECY